MDIRAITFSLSILLTFFTCNYAIAARDPNILEFRDILKNTTDYKCWCEECKCINATYFNSEVWYGCSRVMGNMYLKLGYFEASFDHVVKSTRDLMFDCQDFCGEPVATITTSKNCTNGQCKTMTSTDKLTEESCIHLFWQHEAEKQQAIGIALRIVFAFLVILIGGGLIYEFYQRYVEQWKETNMPQESAYNMSDV